MTNLGTSEKIKEMKGIVFMNNIETQFEPAYFFAAMKLIQQLCADGLISREMFQEILSENSDKVDASEFVFYNS